VKLDLAQARQDVLRLCASPGSTCRPTRWSAICSVGVAQRVEILKTLYRGARILILDEPTAVLSPPEVREFWRVLRRCATPARRRAHHPQARRGVAVSDRITVMRRGATVAHLVTRDTTPRRSRARWSGATCSLPGRRAGAHRTVRTPSRCSRCAAWSSTARAARRSSRHRLRARARRDLGIAGVEGNGQTSCIEALAGLRAVAAAASCSAAATSPRSRVGARAAGPRAYPEDRHRRGLILDYTLAENLVLGRQDLFSKHGLLDRHRMEKSAADQIAAYDVRPTDPALPARALSAATSRRSSSRARWSTASACCSRRSRRAASMSARSSSFHASSARRGARQGRSCSYLPSSPR
jgi:simple sugar transport system ATP-binding protein